jgi:hypothetical protein
MFNPTKEQLTILSEFHKHKTLKINACAGSGKTSTLVLLANENKLKSLYIAFNKLIVEESKERMPKHVQSKTSHSLAWADFGVKLQDKITYNKFKPLIHTPTKLAEHFKVSDLIIDASNQLSVSASKICSLASKVADNFQNSDSTSISKEHLPFGLLKELYKAKPETEEVKDQLEKQIITLGTKIWNSRIDLKSVVKANHDTYLKLWQLSNPVLDYDVIYVDEAQDSNPTVLDVLKKQKAKIVYVGDTYQNIYGFRGAKNAMEEIDAPTFYLTKSFRYGEDIAQVARMVIDEAIDVKGNEKILSKVSQDVQYQKKYTMLFRSNARLIAHAFELVKQKKAVHVEIDMKDFISKVRSIDALKQQNTKYVLHPTIMQYSSFDELVVASEEDAELKTALKIVGENDVFKLVKKLEELETRSKADIILTTAHKAKGKEWDSVVVADDFPLTKDFDCLSKLNQAEINLLYVAVTRAKYNLQLPKNLYSYYDEYINVIEYLN